MKKFLRMVAPIMRLPFMRNLHNIFFIPIVSVVFIFQGCDKKSSEPLVKHGTPEPAPHFQVVDTQGKNFVIEEKVFVPVYPHIGIGESGAVLAITVTIHNTDFEKPIIVNSVRYYDHKGKMVQEYLKESHSLEPMGSAEFTLQPAKEVRNSALSFIVEWKSESQVTVPVINAVVAGRFGTHSYAFLTAGTTVRNAQPVPQ
jgi:hypothetical protein